MKRIINSIIAAWKHEAVKKEMEARFEAEARKLDEQYGELYIS